MRQRQSAHSPHSCHVQLKGVVPVPLQGAFGCAGNNYASVVEQNTQLPQILNHLIDHAAAVLRPGVICRNKNGLATIFLYLGCDRFSQLNPPTSQRYHRTLFSKCLRCGSAYTRRSPSDQNNSSGEPP
jgi:hypothetical protein